MSMWRERGTGNGEGTRGQSVSKKANEQENKRERRGQVVPFIVGQDYLAVSQVMEG